MYDIKYINLSGYNDIEFSTTEAAGTDFSLLAGPARVQQDLAKASSTPIGLLPYVNYGTSLPALLNNKYAGQDTLTTAATYIELMVRYLAQMEESAIDSEKISSISSLNINFSGGQLTADLVVDTVSADSIGLRTVI